MTSDRTDEQILHGPSGQPFVEQHVGSVGGHDRLNEAPLDKAQHLLNLAGLAASMGDFRMAARFYEEAKEWTAFALRDG